MGAKKTLAVELTQMKKVLSFLNMGLGIFQMVLCGFIFASLLPNIQQVYADFGSHYNLTTLYVLSGFGLLVAIFSFSIGLMPILNRRKSWKIFNGQL